MEQNNAAWIPRIRELIASEGRMGVLAVRGRKDEPIYGIPFDRYMAYCLYDEEHGYYKSGRARVGKDGDFYTSASIGSVLGDVLADDLLLKGALPNEEGPMYEWGAGTGRLGLQLLARWRSRVSEQAEAIRYRMVDGHPEHRRTAEAAAREAGFASPVVECLSPEEAEERLREGGRPAVVLANELLDAFPVRRLIRRGGSLWEIGTAYDEETGLLCDCYLPLSDEDERRASSEEIGLKLREGQEGEWRAAALEWLRQTCRLVPGGTIVLIDYGDEAQELFAGHRMRGTLLCYYKHQAHDNPYLHPGEQDMTAHVNFTAIRAAAAEEGWETVYYGTQKRYLVDHGVLELLQAHHDPNPFSEAAKRNRAIRQLLLSDGMSELFKVLVLSKPQA